MVLMRVKYIGEKHYDSEGNPRPKSVLNQYHFMPEKDYIALIPADISEKITSQWSTMFAYVDSLESVNTVKDITDNTSVLSAKVAELEQRLADLMANSNKLIVENDDLKYQLSKLHDDEMGQETVEAPLTGEEKMTRHRKKKLTY